MKPARARQIITGLVMGSLVACASTPTVKPSTTTKTDTAAKATAKPSVKPSPTADDSPTPVPTQTPVPIGQDSPATSATPVASPTTPVASPTATAQPAASGTATPPPSAVSAPGIVVTPTSETLKVNYATLPVQMAGVTTPVGPALLIPNVEHIDVVTAAQNTTILLSPLLGNVGVANLTALTLGDVTATQATIYGALTVNALYSIATLTLDLTTLQATATTVPYGSADGSKLYALAYDSAKKRLIGAAGGANDLVAINPVTGDATPYGGTGAAAASSTAQAIATLHTASPDGLAITGTSLYVAVSPGQILLDDMTTDQATLAAGTGVAGLVNASAASAQFSGPTSLFLNGTQLLVADLKNNAIRRLDLTSHKVDAFTATGGAALVTGARGVGALGTKIYAVDATGAVISFTPGS